ncbi:hypothetical protein LIER_19469 [Lithospermum erythrorhizon]|uniref:Uncharacterized protein n=1 Tax=Lithospermum erythrorhizon TaxID=34254 RepID=A0AAV3QKH5_LITER
MAYRVQNHGMDLTLPSNNNKEALLIQMESPNNNFCTHVSRQFLRSELLKLLSKTWITKYEKVHDNDTPIQYDNAMFTKLKDGSVSISFKETEVVTKSSIFNTEINVITPLEPFVIPISSFNKEANPSYVFKDEDGHRYFDVCECQYCIMQYSDDEDKDSNPYKRKNKKKNRKKSMQHQLKQRYEAGDPKVDLLGEPSGKGFEYYVLYSRSKLPDHVMPEINMFQRVSQDPSSNFERDDIKHSWKVKNPLVRNSDGATKQTTTVEATLNWQSANALAQNILLKQIASNQEKFYHQTQQKVSIIEAAIQEIQKKMALLHQEYLHLASSGLMASPLISQKEAELKFLKA